MLFTKINNHAAEFNLKREYTKPEPMKTLLLAKLKNLSPKI
jgi:hypothetical protein